MTVSPEQLPPRLLPILYVALAHIALALAFAAVAADPRAVAGFFYHARMLAVVHLVTLGWITCSILGATERTEWTGATEPTEHTDVGRVGSGQARARATCA